MKVSTLLEGLKYICCQGSTEQEVSTVVYDSRKVEENSLFICIRGAVVDGHKFVPDVIRKGAKTLVVEEEVEAPEEVTVIKVADTRYAMAFISAAYFGHPAEKLKTIGIKGHRITGICNIYGKIHSRKCRIQSWTDRNHRSDHWRRIHSGKQHNSGILSGAGIFS